MAVAAMFNRRFDAFAAWPFGWRRAWGARTHCAEIEPVCKKRETEHARDCLRLSHFLSRSGVNVGEDCSRYLPILIFALLCLGSTAVLGVDATGQAPVDPFAVLSNPILAQSIDSLSATRERPLFSPTRRPPAPPAAAAPVPIVRRADPAPPPSPPGVVLLGVVIGADIARAFLRFEPPDKTLRVEIGDDIGGWKVSRIEQHELVLSLGDRSATFTIFNSAKTTEPPPSVEPSPTPAQTQPSFQFQQTQPRIQAQQTQPSLQARRARAQTRPVMR
jgi:general secretion pathway protein N